MLTASPCTLNQKKKKITENQKIQPSCRWQRNQIGGRESIPQCPILPIQSKSAKANQTQQQTKHREHIKTEVIILKKNPQYTHKNQTPANPWSRRRDAAARSPSPSSLAPHRRSEIADRSASAPVLGAPSGPPSRYFSLFLSLFISLSLK